MSWLARSLANSLILGDDNNNIQIDAIPSQSEPDPINQSDRVELGNATQNDLDYGNEGQGGGGVKEDLSEFTESLTRQFWGVASFLAPPPPPPPPPPPTINRISRDEVDENVKEDEDEEQDSGSYYYYTDNYDYDMGDEEDMGDAVGVTEEALTFAHNIAHHPETWLDFPFEEEEEEGFQDFQISDSQYKHAFAIQRFVPTLAALRIELCPVHMSEGYFWMVYFVLLHSRLNKNDADQLSSAELVQARSIWRKELQKRVKPETDWFGRSTFYSQESTPSPRDVFDPELPEDCDTRHLFFNTYNAGSRPYHKPTYNETDKQIVESDETRSAETPSGNSERDLLTYRSAQILPEPDDEDDWLLDTSDLVGYSTAVNEEDVSFSDLEEDSDWTMPTKSR